MFFKTTSVALVLVALATAGPAVVSTSIPISARDADLVTFCFSDSSCFQASASVNAGCVDLPEFSETFETGMVSAPGIENPGCGAGFNAALFDYAGTVELSTLGISTVGSYICVPDADLINLCWPASTNLGCFQATTITDGCANLPRFSPAFASVSLTTPGTQCTLFQNPNCTGNSSVVSDPRVDIELSPLGLTNVQSFSCLNPV
ncbi:hypothetical protein FB451DRAFT_1164901 [Mycena latifolia]|nr:hypothetical protein FB451DRAFT_1164901 [Mycena latifolia]